MTIFPGSPEFDWYLLLTIGLESKILFFSLNNQYSIVNNQSPVYGSFRIFLTKL